MDILCELKNAMDRDTKQHMWIAKREITLEPHVSLNPAYTYILPASE